jgi:succinate-semialdehyde dehydrogenase/glutarate-semialdehyde dehydrogenase
MHMAIASIDPTSGETFGTFDALSAQELEAKIQRASSACRSHHRTSFADRATRILRAAEILEAEKESLARLMTMEMGKPIKSAPSLHWFHRPPTIFDPTPSMCC